MNSEIDYIANEVEAAALSLKSALESLAVFEAYLETFKFHDVKDPIQRALYTLNDLLHNHLP